MPPSNTIERHAAARVNEALADTRAVLINGARQAGKSTLARQIAKNTGAGWYTPDHLETREQAAADPTGFVTFDHRMVIDEIQRDPSLLLAIKAAVDEDSRPGRFLLTGSARVMGLRDLPDTLVGRMETIELWPFSQGELDGTPDGFVDVAFSAGPELRHTSDITRDDYMSRVARGGFPEAVRRSGVRRSDFLTGYVADIINRDVIQLSEIERGAELRALVRLLAGRNSGLLTPANLASELGLSQQTVSRYLSLLEEVFLIKRIPAWSRRIGSRSTRQNKVAFVDSGIAAALLGQNEPRLRRIGSPFGQLFEGFISMEIARQLTWSAERATLQHYRTRDGIEVDLVIENLAGEVIGIEIKATATPKQEDFKGLKYLEERLGPGFKAGYLLHTGTRTMPFGPKLRAVPASVVWQAGGVEE